MTQLRPLNSELDEIVCKDLNEVKSRIPDDLLVLRSWLEKQPHLRTRFDDQFLIAFLRFCKYSLENAKKRIDYFYTYKSNAKELIKSYRIDDKIIDIAQSDIFYTLPKPLGAGGPRIHLTIMANINPTLHTVADMFRYHVMRSEIEINTDDNWNIAGVVEIVDFSKIPIGFLKQFDLNLFKQMAAMLENGIPTNLMGTHVINASKEVQIMLSLIRNVMKQKNLLNIHATLESLQQAIGLKYLPQEYGGYNGSLKACGESYLQILKSFKNYFDEDEKYGVNEKLHLEGVNSVTGLFGAGVSGSFRKLDID